MAQRIYKYSNKKMKVLCDHKQYIYISVNLLQILWKKVLDLSYAFKLVKNIVYFISIDPIFMTDSAIQQSLLLELLNWLGAADWRLSIYSFSYVYIYMLIAN